MTATEATIGEFISVPFFFWIALRGAQLIVDLFKY